MTLAVLGVLVVLALAAWLLIIRPHQDLLGSDEGGRGTSIYAGKPKAGQADQAGAMDLDQLLAEARRAMNEQRYLAPAGNNAFEFYLKALEQQPNNAVALDALRETFPFAAGMAEQAINARDFNEAQREIDLLAKADQTNYTVTILRSKLDAQRRLQDKEQQDAQERQRQQQLAAQKAAEERAAAEQQAQQPKTAQETPRAPEASRPQPTRAPAPAPAEVAQTGTAAASAPSATEAVLERYVPPRYPTQARRANQEGWVDVEYDIDAEGNVTDTRVLASQPRHMFDREATEAVRRWKFKPATRDGAPVASQGRRRIEFKLQ